MTKRITDQQRASLIDSRDPRMSEETACRMIDLGIKLYNLLRDMDRKTTEHRRQLTVSRGAQ